MNYGAGVLPGPGLSLSLSGAVSSARVCVQLGAGEKAACTPAFSQQPLPAPGSESLLWGHIPLAESAHLHLFWCESIYLLDSSSNPLSRSRWHLSQRAHSGGSLRKREKQWEGVCGCCAPLIAHSLPGCHKWWRRQGSPQYLLMWIRFSYAKGILGAVSWLHPCIQTTTLQKWRLRRAICTPCQNDNHSYGAHSGSNINHSDSKAHGAARSLITSITSHRPGVSSWARMEQTTRQKRTAIPQVKRKNTVAAANIPMC